PHVTQVIWKGEASFGQGGAAGGPLDAPPADPRLQRGDAPADGGLGDTQFARGCAEAAAVDYREKSLGFGKAGLIHAYIGFMISRSCHINPKMAIISLLRPTIFTRLHA